MMRPKRIGAFALLMLGLLAPQTLYAAVFTGKLVGAKGIPLVGARVIYHCTAPHARSLSEAFLKFSAVSAGDGTFAFNDFPTGAVPKLPVTFGVQLPNGHLSTATFPARGATVTVRDQQTTAIFKVVDAHGKGIGGADIVLKGVVVNSPDGSGFLMQAGEFANPRHYKSGPDGVLRVPNLPARFDIYFDCALAGYPQETGNFKTVAGLPSQIAVTLVQGVTLRGRVSHLGKPAPGASVQSTSYKMESFGWVGKPVSTKTDAQGIYSIVVPPGSIKITAMATLDAKPLFSIPLSGVHAAEGTELEGLDISLVDAIIVTGRVLERDTEKPVKDARVDGVFGDMGQTKTTGLDGTFTMTVPPGKAQVRVQHVGAQELSYPYPEVNATIDADHNPPLTFFIEHTALLPPILGLDGVVKNLQGQPVVSARLGIIAGETQAKTDAHGRFKFGAQLNPGSKLYAVGRGAATSTSMVLIDQHHVDITLDVPSAECSGNIIDDVGQPVAGAEITLYGESDKFIFIVPFDHAKSDAAGRFHFSGVYPGMPGYVIKVQKPGFGDAFKDDFKVKPGQNLAVENLKISRADAALAGKVLDSEGKPAEGITVVCESAKAITDKQGAFHLTNVLRGKNQIQAGGLEGESGSASARGGQTDVVIRMQKSVQAPSTSYDDMRGQAAGILVPGEWLNASSIDLASLKGKIVVIDLWAVWCGPCIRALPAVEALYQKYGANGVSVIGIHVTGTPLDEARKFVKQKGLTYPVFMDTPQGANIANFPAKGVPQLYVISAAGKVVCDTHDVAEAVKAVEAELKQRHPIAK
ncbi:MAG: thiol-disulfide isomerase-like thioredoxin [Chthonomonadaceae bacterium]|nr:thiol-disulfide isomerase-like thioredoxin [Chthonomonadaceae bacterium]